jgi:hypothetical protein
MKNDGKYLLHLALDNESGLELIEALLQFAPIWQRINDPIHLYEDATALCTLRQNTSSMSTKEALQCGTSSFNF